MAAFLGREIEELIVNEDGFGLNITLLESPRSAVIHLSFYVTIKH